MLHYLYTITRRDGKEYVGVSIHPKQRLNQHRHGRGSVYLKGLSDLKLKILVGGTERYIYELEKAYILKYSPALNIAIGGRGGAHKNYPIGEKSGQSKLTDKSVLEIRLSHFNGESKNSLAIKYGVTPPTISAICFGQTWKHIGGPLSKPEIHFNEDLKKEAKILRGEGFTYKDIAEALSIGETTAYRYCKANDSI